MPERLPDRRVGARAASDLSRRRVWVVRGDAQGAVAGQPTQRGSRRTDLHAAVYPAAAVGTVQNSIGKPAR